MKTTRVRIQYIGARLFSTVSGRTAHVFLHGKKELYYKARMPFVRLGQWYWAEKHGATDVRLKSYSPQVAKGPEPTESQMRNWEEQECIALGIKAELREQRKFRSHKGLIDLFHEKMAEFTGSESRAFARFVCEEVAKRIDRKMTADLNKKLGRRFKRLKIKL